MKSTKIVLLILILAFPVAIYLFLQAFGNNEFDLPVFYKNGIDSVYNECNSGERQFTIPDFELNQLGSDRSISNKQLKDQLTVVIFPDLVSANFQRLENEFIRVNNSLSENTEDVQLLLVIRDTDVSGLPESIDDLPLVKILSGTGDYLATLEKCVFVLPNQSPSHHEYAEVPTNHAMLLIDEELRIRGYYDAYQTEEIDRLIVETRILLANKMK